MSEEFDVIVIGAGPAGENVAARAARGGMDVAIVEESLVGGECSYFACVPSKTLLRPVELAAEAARTPGLAPVPVDTGAVLAWRDQIVSHLDDSRAAVALKEVPAQLFRGRGRLAGPKQVDVDLTGGGTARLTARHAVVLATGSRALVPAIPGLAEARPWTSHEATAVRSVPRRVAVLGGGPVACEIAQLLHGLGAEQTVVLVRGRAPLGNMEPFAGRLVADSFAAGGIDLRTGVGVTRVERRVGNGEVTVHLADVPPIVADELVVATGRVAASADLGVDTVGLKPGAPVQVDDSMRATGVEGGWLYAVSDVGDRTRLTHMGKYQGRVCGDVIAARAKGEPDDLPAMRDVASAYGPPQVIFTDPQVGAVGLTEAAARKRGHHVRVVEYDLGAVSGAYVREPAYRGRAKAVVDEDRQVLLGATFVGPGVAELVHSATVAVTSEVPLERLWHAVPSFPTISEVWLRLLEEYGL
ncbi:dihydrolipoyl dehydrogenase family protein [Nonomuraea sp. NPDC050790]|uniref:dihydrolipoyl dehydrogenase family protein n=1 Tax=Nonomuraea sp. NPDC050790 TaxID=3364371 RepID=UPI003799A225